MIACLAGLKIPWYVEGFFMAFVLMYVVGPFLGGLALYRAKTSTRRFTWLGTISLLCGCVYLALTIVATILSKGKMAGFIIAPVVAALLGARAILLRRRTRLAAARDSQTASTTPNPLR